jgi:hypothetical protein
VATQLRIRHPDNVRAIVAHEPPSFGMLSEEHRAKAVGFIEHVYSVYRTNGVQTAMEVFSSVISEG